MNANRPLCLFCVSLISGILLYHYTGISFFLIFLFISIILTLIFYQKLKKRIIVIFFSLMFFIFGGLLINNAQKTYYCVFDGYYNKTVIISGYVDSEVEIDSQGKAKFILKTNKIEYLDSSKNIKGRLIAYISKNTGNTLKYRSRVKFQSVIEEPKAATNPGGFDYKRYLASISSSGTVYLPDFSAIELHGNKGGGFVQKLGINIKKKVLGIIEYSLDENQAGLLSGMLIGYKDGLGEAAYTAFSKAGLTHIMVASGMNVAFIILPFAFLFKKLRVNNFTANIATISILILFVFITGFSASVVRAVIMGVIILTGKIIMRETDIFTSVSAAAIILLFLNPFTIFDIGFQLSFGATISLVLFYPSLKKFFDHKYVPNLVSDTLAATIAAQIGVVPITLYYFNSFSTISILSNLLVVPLVQIITIIGFIMVFAGLLNTYMAVLIGYINNTFLSFVLFITEYTSKIPYASLKLTTPPMTLIIIYYITLIYILKGRSILNNISWFRHIKRLCITLAAIIFIFNAIIPSPLEVNFLDVGEGDCAFIKTAGGTKILIDGGGRTAGSKSKFDIGESVVVPYILDRGTKKVDIVVATHGHSDHTEGLEAVLKELKVGALIIPDTDGEGLEKITAICNDKNINIIKCRFGDRIKLDNETVFDVVSPMPIDRQTIEQQSLNESSLVLKLLYRNVKILFTGDSGIPTEQRMLEQGLDLKADLIKIGHHGSYGSTGEDFIRKVNPAFAVISVGRNSFGHPSQFVVDKLSENKIKLFRTDEKGAIVVTSYGKSLSVKTMLH